MVFNRRVRKSSEAPRPPRNPQTGVGASRAFNNPAYIWWTSNREVVAVPLNGAKPSTPSFGSHVHERARAHARRARAHAAYTHAAPTYTRTHGGTWHRVKPRERGLRRRRYGSLATAFIFPETPSRRRAGCSSWPTKSNCLLVGTRRGGKKPEGETRGMVTGGGGGGEGDRGRIDACVKEAAFTRLFIAPHMAVACAAPRKLAPRRNNRFYATLV